MRADELRLETLKGKTVLTGSLFWCRLLMGPMSIFWGPLLVFDADGRQVATPL